MAIITEGIGGGFDSPNKHWTFLSHLIKTSGVANGFNVRANNPAGMSVLAGGENTPDAAVILNGSDIFPLSVDAPTKVDIPSANVANPRIDAVVIYRDFSVAGNGTPDAPQACGISVIQGAPSASPVAPTDTAIAASSALPVGANGKFVRLADITVPTGATTITNSNIKVADQIKIAPSNIATPPGQYTEIARAKATTQQNKLSATWTGDYNYLRVSFVGNSGAGVTNGTAFRGYLAAGVDTGNIPTMNFMMWSGTSMSASSGVGNGLPMISTGGKMWLDAEIKRPAGAPWSSPVFTATVASEGTGRQYIGTFNNMAVDKTFCVIGDNGSKLSADAEIIVYGHN